MKFEAFKAQDGSYRWRLLDTGGRPLKITPGKVMLPRGSAKQQRASRDAVQNALAKLAQAQASAG